MKTAQSYLTEIEYHLRRAKYALRGKKFSHANEQAILRKYIDQILPPEHNKTAVDIGAGNGMRWSNTYSLFLQGWSGLGIEADAEKFAQMQRAYEPFAKVAARHSTADPENIIGLLRESGIPKDFSVLSLDIDGNDYWVLQSILKEFRPALIVTEINEKIPPPLRFVVKFDPDFHLRHHFYGYSIAAIEDFCEDHGYGILELEYNNVFLGARELGVTRFATAESAYKEGYRNRANRRTRFPQNQDLETLQTMDSNEAESFLRNFYAKEVNKYFLASDRDLFRKMLLE